MTCFVCGEEAQELPGFGGDYRYNCAECGEFRVSTTLHAVIRDRVFDVDQARDELRRQRTQKGGALGLGAELPVLNSDHQYLLVTPG